MSLVPQNNRDLAMRPDQIDYGNPSQPIVRYTMEEMRYMAEAVSKSGLFGALTPPQAFAMLMLAEAEGIHPIQAVRRFYVTEDGKLGMLAATMQAEFTRHGGKIRWVRRDGEECTAEFSHPRLQPEPLTVSYTLKELKDNGIATTREGKLKRNYHRHARAMLHARVVSEGIRAIDPAIVVGLYTPEEISDMDDRDRPAISHQPEPTPDPVRQALDDARRGPVPAASTTEFGQWVELKATEVWGRWREAAKAAGIDPGRPITRNQVANHLITEWLETGEASVDDLLKDDGKRDPHKVAAVLARAWAADPDAIKAEVEVYLTNKVLGLAYQAGITIPGLSPEDLPDDTDDGVAAADAD